MCVTKGLEVCVCVICMCKLIYLFVYRHVSVFYIGLGRGRNIYFQWRIVQHHYIVIGGVIYSMVVP